MTTTPGGMIEKASAWSHSIPHRKMHTHEGVHELVFDAFMAGAEAGYTTADRTIVALERKIRQLEERLRDS